MESDWEIIWGAISDGNMELLDEISLYIDDFPCGLANHLSETRWLNYAVDIGNMDTILWMLAKGAEIDFEDGMGYTVLHTAIESQSKDKYRIMETLIRSGANVNRKGRNDWTPAHLAAARNDVTALEILANFGADFTIRTRIDRYATPLEQALVLGNSPEAVAFLTRVS